jgi:predicted RecB family nuclease
VPRADLEIDVDMEHAEGATYLWGAVVTANANLPGDLRALDGTYRAFVDFDGLDVDREVHLVVALLDWIDELGAVAEANSATWLVAFYSHAEIDELRRIATMSGDTGLISRVERVAKSPNWVDMRVVVEDNLIVGHGVGLKKLAPYAGFSWRDDDPSGSASLTWYDKAVGADDAAERGQYQARLLAYNEDDCRATVALRVWMSTAAFTSIDDWEGPTLGS